MIIFKLVIPAKAGIQGIEFTGFPPRLGLLSRSNSCVHAVVRGNDVR
jgi:hypothetical protein